MASAAVAGSRRRSPRRATRTRASNVVPITSVRNRTPRRKPRFAVRRTSSVGGQRSAAPSLLGLAVSAAVRVEQNLVNAAARLTLAIIDGVETIMRRLFGLQKSAAAQMAGALELVPREAAQVASGIAEAAEQIVAA